MNSNIKTILRDVGLFLHVPGLMALLSVPICILWGEYYAILPFVICGIVPLILGRLLYRLYSRGAQTSKIRHAMITVALCWLIVPIIGAIPFMLIASKLAVSSETATTILNFQDPWNALFEAFSGFTSTGLSVASRVSNLPHSLQWWRSFTEWIGGVGVIVLVISLLEPSTDAYQLYSSEGRDKRIASSVKATARKIWWIYLIYTIASIFIFKIVGMSWWEALNHGMTGISTGGFSVLDNSIGGYAPKIQMAVIVIMILGAVSFPVHYRLLTKGRLSALWSDNQHQALWVFLALGIGLLGLMNYSYFGSPLWLDTAFHWASALGTCGFNISDIYKWNDSAKLLLTLAMVVGGTAGSTVGGFKLNRLILLYKAVIWRFRRISLKSDESIRYELDGKVLDETEAIRRIEAAAVLAFLWIVILIISMFILLQLALPNYKLGDVLFEAASALGSVGISVGISNPELPWLGKFTLIILMWMGRLEIIPVLILFTGIRKILTVEAGEIKSYVTAPTKDFEREREPYR
ncbi:TrkH family potassium uptake protein [Mastigocoleus testarum]|uniref:Potassium transporter n=1 Tax=Mastigocoleus testarum BC008 TaxID=371196 RepID=A0A0V7ZYN2_9CYAN|nr:TrkH family potassium uptake protein [Mastigocoleus testarum]KST69559.1 potassium transporter [Mastigocoleus testarum BC008]